MLVIIVHVAIILSEKCADLIICGPFEAIPIEQFRDHRSSFGGTAGAPGRVREIQTTVSGDDDTLNRFQVP